jgi:hypothetical protein
MTMFGKSGKGNKSIILTCRFQEVCEGQTQHALPGQDDLLRLFLKLVRSEPAQRLPQLSSTLPTGQVVLAGPHASVNEFEKELPRTRVEDNDGPI